jgi:hypothetical protein
VAGGAASGLDSERAQRPHERTDRWWIEPVMIVSILGAFVVYSLVVSVMNANYFYEPYLSPFYSPCLTTGCIHPTWPIIGNWYTLSPAFLIVGRRSHSA